MPSVKDDNYSLFFISIVDLLSYISLLSVLDLRPPSSQNISHKLGSFGLKFSGMSDPGEELF